MAHLIGCCSKYVESRKAYENKLLVFSILFTIEALICNSYDKAFLLQFFIQFYDFEFWEEVYFSMHFSENVWWAPSTSNLLYNTFYHLA